MNRNTDRYSCSCVLYPEYLPDPCRADRKTSLGFKLVADLVPRHVPLLVGLTQNIDFPVKAIRHKVPVKI